MPIPRGLNSQRLFAQMNEYLMSRMAEPHPWEEEEEELELEGGAGSIYRNWAKWRVNQSVGRLVSR